MPNFLFFCIISLQLTGISLQLTGISLQLTDAQTTKAPEASSKVHYQ